MEIINGLKCKWTGFWRGVLVSLAEEEMTARRDEYDTHLENVEVHHSLETAPRE